MYCQMSCQSSPSTSSSYSSSSSSSSDDEVPPIAPPCCGAAIRRTKYLVMPCCGELYHAICIDVGCSPSNRRPTPTCLTPRCRQPVPFELLRMARTLSGCPKRTCPLCLEEGFLEMSYNHDRRHFCHPICMAEHCGDQELVDCPGGCGMELPGSVVRFSKTLWKDLVVANVRRIVDDQVSFLPKEEGGAFLFDHLRQIVDGRSPPPTIDDNQVTEKKNKEATRLNDEQVLKAVFRLFPPPLSDPATRSALLDALQSMHDDRGPCRDGVACFLRRHQRCRSVDERISPQPGPSTSSGTSRRRSRLPRNPFIWS